jgi:hypothetical protein
MPISVVSLGDKRVPALLTKVKVALATEAIQRTNIKINNFFITFLLLNNQSYLQNSCPSLEKASKAAKSISSNL